MQPLEEHFAAELRILERLFGTAKVQGSIQRLNGIYAHAENKWEDYNEHIPNGVVKYLLIAEAPPWSEDGPPQFVLDPSSRPRTLMRALQKTFLKGQPWRDPAEALIEFAGRGFLIVDSIPFFMKYCSKKRKTAEYRELVEMTVGTYLTRKLMSSSLSWSTDLRVALGFKLNAIAIMRALNGRLSLGHVSCTIGPELIAANGSGFPDATKLRSIYALDDTDMGSKGSNSERRRGGR